MRSYFGPENLSYVMVSDMEYRAFYEHIMRHKTMPKLCFLASRKVC